MITKSLHEIKWIHMKITRTSVDLPPTLVHDLNMFFPLVLSPKQFGQDLGVQILLRIIQSPITTLNINSAQKK